MAQVALRREVQRLKQLGARGSKRGAEQTGTEREAGGSKRAAEEVLGAASAAPTLEEKAVRFHSCQAPPVGLHAEASHLR
eukprot:6019086-Amphidinium_carterae.1